MHLSAEAGSSTLVISGGGSEAHTFCMPDGQKLRSNDDALNVLRSVSAGKTDVGQACSLANAACMYESNVCGDNDNVAYVVHDCLTP
jgi:hypothetical protein